MLNSDLNSRNDVSDLLAEADMGRLGKRIVMCGANTLNTPYKAGLTLGAEGVAYINMTNDNYGTILFITSGGDDVFCLYKHNGTWSPKWSQFVANSDLSEYFRDDTNGNTYIFSRYEYPRATIIETADGEIILRSSKSESTYNQIRISDTSMYIDWVASGEPTVTKKIIDKND